MKKAPLFAFIIVALLIVVTLVNNQGSRQLEVENRTMTDTQGSNRNILFHEKPTVFLFFTSWCPYCNEDAPKVVSLHDKYKNDIQIYGINLANRDDRDELMQYMSLYKIEYPVLLDEESDLYKSFGSPGFPTLIFFDKNGRETKRIVGSTTSEDMEAQFKRAIERF